MKSAFLFLLTFLSFFTRAQTFKLLIGTYTNTGSKGIYVYRFNASTGKADWVSNTDSVSNPSFLTISQNKKFIYAVNETQADTPGRVSAFKYNNISGKLKFINSQVTGGDNPCYVSVTRSNKWVAVANYTSGNLSVFPVNKDGSLKPFSELIQDTGSSTNVERQKEPHVHSAVFSPDEHFLFTPDLGVDKVMIYAVHQSAKQLLSPANPSFVKVMSGDGPRHFTFAPDQKFAYLSEELSGSVSVYKYRNGNLKFIQRSLTHAKNYKGDIGTADLHLSPDGKFLYVSNRGDENTITIFSVDTLTGKLTLKGYQSTMGKTPRNFMIDPTGNFLLVANQSTDNIVIFKRNKQSGLIKPTGNEIKIPRPVFLKMVE